MLLLGRAARLWSRSEKSQQPTNPIGIEKSAGRYKGMGPSPWDCSRTSSQIDGLSTVRSTAEAKPKNPPITAPQVVSRFQYMESSRTGKLHDGRDGEGEAHHEGDVVLLEQDAEHDRENAEHHRRDLGNADLLTSRSARPLANTLA